MTSSAPSSKPMSGNAPTSRKYGKKPGAQGVNTPAYVAYLKSLGFHPGAASPFAAPAATAAAAGQPLTRPERMDAKRKARQHRDNPDRNNTVDTEAVSRTWVKIKPTHVTREGLRIEILQEDDTHMKCRVKKPSEAMQEMGCMGCPGPHSRTNRYCNVNSTAFRPVLARGRLMNMKTRAILPWLYYGGEFTWNTEDSRAGTAVFRKAHSPV